jgi:hypothetical protein
MGKIQAGQRKGGVRFFIGQTGGLKSSLEAEISADHLHGCQGVIAGCLYK